MGNVRLKVAPGAIVAESNAPPFAVDVCAVLSLFIHVTVPPTDTVTGFGEYAVVVRLDEPLTIETRVPVGVGVGVGVDGEFEEPPHAQQASATAGVNIHRNKRIL